MKKFKITITSQINEDAKLEKTIEATNKHAVTKYIESNATDLYKEFIGVTPNQDIDDQITNSSYFDAEQKEYQGRIEFTKTYWTEFNYTIEEVK